MEQILINLVKNAIESMKGKVRKITIKSTVISSKQIAISICDTGGGINEEKLPHIFTPFYTTKKEGNGIGLTLCKQIMHMHKGQISIASEPGEGTTVTLLFPCE
ncbi:MAG: ATP-binding protein [Bacteroidales bacterium]